MFIFSRCTNDIISTFWYSLWFRTWKNPLRVSFPGSSLLWIPLFGLHSCVCLAYWTEGSSVLLFKEVEIGFHKKKLKKHMVNLDAYRWKLLKQRLHHPCVWSTLSCQEYPKKRHTKGGAVNGGPLHTVQSSVSNQKKNLTRFWDMFSIAIHVGINILKAF